jgi:predicted transcriptional regulator of viral defense system
MTQRLQTRCFKEALGRVQHLFVETPGATLTTADAAQMAGLDRQVCRVLLRTLIEAGFLEQRVRGMFVRRSPDSHYP